MGNQLPDFASGPLRRIDLPGGAAGQVHVPIGDRVPIHEIEHLFPIEPVDEDQVLNEAFDAYIAAGQSAWLLARTGPSIPAVLDDSGPQLPEGAADIPRLEGDLLPNMLGGGHGEWFQPGIVLRDDDSAFGFTANQTGEVAEDGGPFNRATLTLGLKAVLPAALAHIEHLRQVPNLVLTPTLTVPVTARDGTTVVEKVVGRATPGLESTFTATFELKGSIVAATYTHLTRRGGAKLEITGEYSGYQTTLVSIPDAGFPHPPTFRGYLFQVFGDGGITGGAPFEPVRPFPGGYHFFPVTASFPRTIAVGLTYDTDAYRSRFTITTADMTTRPIIDANDLSEFAGPRSEYRELTTLGDIEARYPSLQRLYFGQVSGTVVAVPASYGIQRGAAGLAARCDAIIDDSPVSITGSRYHFTFTVAPMVDPIDMAQLRTDVTGIPEAAGRTLRVWLPEGLDSRNPSSITGFPTATATFADGTASAIELGVDIADDHSTPATTNVNLFLHQLASAPPSPLFGSIAVRLDDDYPQPVHSRLTLSLYQTADGDDLTVTRQSTTPPTILVTNQSPLDEVLHRTVAAADHQVAITSLGDQTLAAGQSMTVPDPGRNFLIDVSRGLALPLPIPSAAVLRYIAFHSATVQQVQHPLTVNAAGINFAAAGITTIEIQFTLTGHPGIAVSPMTLSRSHPLDFVHAQIPVDAAVTGLDTTVVMTVATAGGTRTVTVDHDFIDEPILVLTANAIA